MRSPVRRILRRLAQQVRKKPGFVMKVRIQSSPLGCKVGLRLANGGMRFLFSLSSAVILSLFLLSAVN
jgi:hypothetical protein